MIKFKSILDNNKSVFIVLVRCREHDKSGHVLDSLLNKNSTGGKK